MSIATTDSLNARYTPTEAAQRSSTRSKQTRLMLASAAVAAPLFIVTALSQAFTRHGFSVTHNAISQLDLGSLGWIQRADFLTTGLLLATAAWGLHRALVDGPGQVWIPRLLALAAAGTAAAGVFVPDPSYGFPPGTPLHAKPVNSWHGDLHFIVSSAAFVAFIAICVILGRRAASEGRTRTRALSYLVALGSAACIATAGGPNGAISMFIGISIAILWVCVGCLRAASGR